MQIKSELAKFVGEGYVSDSLDERMKYSRDFSLLPPGIPEAVVWPASAEEVSKVVRWCNEQEIPIVPVSSMVHFYGCTIPKEGGIIVDLSRMNKILEIDTENRFVRYEPGVTWSQLVEELKKKG
jgi:FAD/FMN-containing dehydrogenase